MEPRPPLGVALALAAHLGACGGTVAGAGPGDAGSESGGHATDGGTGGGGPIACGRTNDELSVKLVWPDGTSPWCSFFDGGTSGTREGTGQVIETSSTSLKLETCPPNADCAESIVALGVEAPGLELRVPPGAIVRLSHTTVVEWSGCGAQLAIQNVPSWGGLTSPVSAGDEHYLVAAEGTYEHPGAPFTVERLPLGCPSDAGRCGEPPDDFALVFHSAPGDPGVTVAMGHTALVGEGGPSPMAVRNLRSFVSGYCDDYWNWAWWAVPARGE